MKKLIVLAAFLFAGATVFSQDMKNFKLYKPEENAEQAIADAVKLAKEKGRHVFVQVGGNWCIWCARFNNFITEDKDILSYIEDSYVVYHLNYSKENKNAAVLGKYGFPQRFGFPVFLILNGDGQLIHTENSAYLEQGEGYSKLKVIEFLKNWTKSALDPEQYKEQ
jgi:thioredoxin-related protein